VLHAQNQSIKVGNRSCLHARGYRCENSRNSRKSADMDAGIMHCAFSVPIQSAGSFIETRRSGKRRTCSARKTYANESMTISAGTGRKYAARNSFRNFGKLRSLLLIPSQGSILKRVTSVRRKVTHREMHVQRAQKARHEIAACLLSME